MGLIFSDMEINIFENPAFEVDVDKVFDYNERIFMEEVEHLTCIYTNSICANTKSKKAYFLPYTELTKSLHDWIDDRADTNIQTKSERVFERLLSTTNVDFESEVFFMINNRKYFADFFLPKYMIVFEIDGGYHKRDKSTMNDMLRDNELKNVGITTLRYTNAQLTLPNIKSIINADFMSALNGAFKTSKYHFVPNTNKHNLKETTAQKVLKAIIKKIEELSDNIELCIEVDLSHLLIVLQYDDYKKKADYWQDYELIESFYQAIERKGIKHAVIYKGRNNNLTNKYKYRVKALNNYTTIDCCAKELL